MDDLIKYSLRADPLESFGEWYVDAKKVEQNPEAMTLASYDSKNKRPNARTVLFKGIKKGALTFYTNYQSHKAHEFNDNNEASIVFYWHLSKRQVRIQGRVTKMGAEDSKNYFHSRDRQSQLASMISEQSSPIESKEVLLERLQAATKKYDGVEIPCPVNWGGFLFEPYEFEFFVYGDYRINDRFLYEKKEGTWTVTRLQP